MRKVLGLIVTLLLVAALSGYALWTQQRPTGHYLSDLRSRVVLNQGEPNDRGNLLGIQPELLPADYQSPERLRLKLAAHLEKARTEGLLNEHTVVVLPEHIGTWLVLAGEKPEVYHARTLEEARMWLLASNPLPLAGALFGARDEDRLAEALFRMKAKGMARDYQMLFGGLARTFGVTLVAGTIVLPAPRVENGQLVMGEGPLQHLSLTFDRSGTAQKPTFPPRDTQGFPSATLGLLEFVETPRGRLGALLAARLAPDATPFFGHVQLWPRPATARAREPGARLFNFWL